MTILLAMDRALSSNRRLDADGRLHVDRSNISKANVCLYLGREIPGWQELGLDGNRIYRLLRHPDELAKAVGTFNNLQILSEHIPVSSWDDDAHMAAVTVGSTGTDCTFDGQYLTNSTVYWAKPSIDGILNERKRQLSSAYRYRADMTPGNFNGIAYDGVMRDIVGNHVALVFEGRAGPDVIVGDQKPMLKSYRANLLTGGLATVLRPLLAQDAKFDLSPALSGVTDATLAADGAPQALAERVYGLVQPHLAQDAALEIPVLVTAIEAVRGIALDEADEIPAAAPAVTVTHVTPAVVPPIKVDAPPAMDAAAVQAMVDTAARAARAAALSDAAAIRTAEREVQPVVGELVALDSAEAIYEQGLKAFNVALDGLDKSAYGATFRAVKAARDALPTIAQDARTKSDPTDFNKRYPNRTNLVRG